MKLSLSVPFTKVHVTTPSGVVGHALTQPVTFSGAVPFRKFWGLSWISWKSPCESKRPECKLRSAPQVTMIYVFEKLKRTDMSTWQGWYQLLQHELGDLVGPSHQLSDHQVPLGTIMGDRPVCSQPSIWLVDDSKVQGNNLIDHMSETTRLRERIMK